MKAVLIFCLSFYLVFAKHELYDGHAVYEVNVKTVDEIKIINELEEELLLDVWSHALPGKPGQILVAKAKKAAFENKLNAANVEYKVAVENIKESLDLEDELLSAAAARSPFNSSRIAFDRVYTYDEVNALMDTLARDYAHVTVVDGGRSFEGRPIRYLRISTTNFQDTRKPIIMMQSLLHCREWIGLPVTLYAIHKLVIDVTESDLVNNIDWIIVPIVNPDGYIYTHMSDAQRYWRKNMRTGIMIGDFCTGVDLNRNFNFNWGTASSNNVCSETYHGSGPMSEPETQVIGNILALYRNRIALFFDVHSFGSMILYGYGTGGLPPNALTIHMVGVNMAQAIDRVKWYWKPNYIVGNIVHVLFEASGCASDYAQVNGVPLSYAYELPAFNNMNWSLPGFLVHPDFIEQAGYETWEGFKVGARHVLNTYRYAEE